MFPDLPAIGAVCVLCRMYATPVVVLIHTSKPSSHRTARYMSCGRPRMALWIRTGRRKVKSESQKRIRPPGRFHRRRMKLLLVH